ncbi:MAG: 1-deoxy-D-xylulose-5-phosphate reductoisomerase [candidate division Zixibacteria bacterium]|nr:1-deoxy-D-xylulose-5-phosphate reductoisomerase [candidate division Zixibacteria bacterium]
MKRITILGSTGSIGQSALDVIAAHPDRFEVVALGAGRNVDLLLEQIGQFHPQFVIVRSEQELAALKDRVPYPEFEISFGPEGMDQAAGLGENDIVLNALVGAVGLTASLAAIRAGKFLALANKESLVVGGPLFADLMRQGDGRILPVDSEHSAIWQCLKAGRQEEVCRLWLTASGGPFRQRDASTFKDITVEEALAHPTWKMGPKITIDSATMINKGLELIEAVWLFSLPPDRVRIVIHPQSIVHSMVEYIDSAIIAQMSTPDMRLPITYALFWPERVESDFGRIDLTQVGPLEFHEPDEIKFPALRLARQAAESGGTAPAALNAANEVAVELFLSGRITFPGITELIEEILVKHTVMHNPELEDILNCDRETRRLARELAGSSR